jgi:hypothetical protein
MSVQDLVGTRPDVGAAVTHAEPDAPPRWPAPDPASIVWPARPTGSGSPVEPEGSHPRWWTSLIRSNAKGFVLLAITASFVLGAVGLFPQDEQTNPSANVEAMDVYSSAPVTLLTVQMEPLKHGGTNLYLAVNVTDTEKQMKAQPDSALYAWVTVPRDTWGSPKSCAAHLTCQPFFDGKDVEVIFYFDNDQPHGFASLHGTLDVPASHSSGYGARTNAEYVRAALPEVQVLASSQTETPMPATVHIQYLIPSADSFSWSGLNPRRLNSLLQWDEQAPTQPSVETGVSLNRESLDNQRIFIAGALLGVAGAFLAAAIDELHSSPRSRARARARARARSHRQ